MEIYFDRKTVKILRYIKWHRNKTLGDLLNKFDKDGLTMLFINLCQADYLICEHPDGSRENYKNSIPYNSEDGDTFWISPKGNKLLEDRFDRLWQWSIPTLISVAALIMSILSAINPGIIKVLLL